MPVGVEQWRAAVGAMARSAAPKPRSPIGPRWNKWLKASDPAVYKGCVVLLVIIAQLVSSGLEQVMEKTEEMVEGSERVCQSASCCSKQTVVDGVGCLMLPLFSNGKRPDLSEVTMIVFVNQMLLMIAGDVERNPGPDILTPSDLAAVINEVHGLSKLWFQLGVQLNIRVEDLKAIKMEYPVKSLVDMLSIWLSNTDPSPPTWQKLADAVSSPAVGKPDVAEKIRKTYIDIHEDIKRKSVSVKRQNVLTPDHLPIVLNALYEVKLKFYDLGIQLNMPLDELNDIYVYTPPDHLFHQMLSNWLKKGAGTWNQVMKAVSSPAINRPDIAKIIRETYCRQDRRDDPGSVQANNAQGPGLGQTDGGSNEQGTSGAVVTVQGDARSAATHCGGPLTPRGTTLADSPGLAILVTCDYEITKGQTTLYGTREDAREMWETFHFLNYVVHYLQNPTADTIKARLRQISDSLENYRGEVKEKVIIFAFSGHGNCIQKTEKIIANDGVALELVGEIVFPLTKHEVVAEIPKLFLIDACRGHEPLLAKGPASKDKAVKSSYFEKGVQHVEGNYRIDYATIPHHVSYVGIDGSMWIPKLARAMREKNDSFQHIAANVMKTVQQQLGEKKQQCESVDRLNTGPLYLQKH